jgi:hypothetical protein
VGVGAGVRKAALSAVVHGAFLPTQSDAVSATGRVEFALLAGGLRGCLALFEGPLDGAGCVGVELGRLMARGRGLSDAATFSDWWLAPELGIALGTDLGQRWTSAPP